MRYEISEFVKRVNNGGEPLMLTGGESAFIAGIIEAFLQRRNVCVLPGSAV
jgi:NAD(P)H-hydrate repair Nnr-like enzyme with NAD(P)H-hydrate dehydratase domain